MMCPWPAMVRAALSAGILPRDFWQLSVREWRWLAAQQGEMTPSTLQVLMHSFPDELEERNDRI